MDAAPQEFARPVVFFDGTCGLCDRTVTRLLRADVHERLLFAPLQGTTARALLPPLPADESTWSLVLRDADGVHEGPDAVLRIARVLGGAWRMAGLARVLPRGVRAWLYRLVARHRFRFFGRRAACRVPTPAERARFLP